MRRLNVSSLCSHGKGQKPKRAGDGWEGAGGTKHKDFGVHIRIQLEKDRVKPRGFIFSTRCYKEMIVPSTHTIPTSFKGKPNLDERFNMPLG